MQGTSGKIRSLLGADGIGLDLCRVGPTNNRKPVIEVLVKDHNQSYPRPEIVLLNTLTRQPLNEVVNGVEFEKQNLLIECGQANKIRINRGTDNGGWNQLYIEGKTTTYDPDPATLYPNNPTNDPKRYPLLRIYRQSGDPPQKADIIRYEGNTSEGNSIQTKESVQDLISSGGGGITFLLQGLCNVTIAPGDASQPETITEQEGYYYINNTAGTANAG